MKVTPARSIGVAAAVGPPSAERADKATRRPPTKGKANARLSDSAFACLLGVLSRFPLPAHAQCPAKQSEVTRSLGTKTDREPCHCVSTTRPRPTQPAKGRVQSGVGSLPGRRDGAGADGRRDHGPRGVQAGRMRVCAIGQAVACRALACLPLRLVAHSSGGDGGGGGGSGRHSLVPPISAPHTTPVIRLWPRVCEAGGSEASEVSGGAAEQQE